MFDSSAEGSGGLNRQIVLWERVLLNGVSNGLHCVLTREMRFSFHSCIVELSQWHTMEIYSLMSL